jgi:biotin carboxyl carrier protein
VRVNNQVARGDVLLKLEDNAARARLTAAKAEATVRERDVNGTKGREGINKAADAVFYAERTVAGARLELDNAITANRKGRIPQNWWRPPARGLPRSERSFAPERSECGGTESEAALAAARANVALAQFLFDKTRIRAPIAGAVLRINVKVGELRHLPLAGLLWLRRGHGVSIVLVSLWISWRCRSHPGATRSRPEHRSHACEASPVSSDIPSDFSSCASFCAWPKMRIWGACL